MTMGIVAGNTSEIKSASRGLIRAEGGREGVRDDPGGLAEDGEQAIGPAIDPALDQEGLLHYGGKPERVGDDVGQHAQGWVRAQEAGEVRVERLLDGGDRAEQADQLRPPRLDGPRRL